MSIGILKKTIMFSGFLTLGAPLQLAAMHKTSALSVPDTLLDGVSDNSSDSDEEQDQNISYQKHVLKAEIHAQRAIKCSTLYQINALKDSLNDIAPEKLAEVQEKIAEMERVLATIDACIARLKATIKNLISSRT